MMSALSRCFLRASPALFGAVLGLTPAAAAESGSVIDYFSGEFLENERLPIYFPPLVPPLDRAILPGPAAGTGLFAAPPELGAYVGESFYPALATRLATRELATKFREPLESYRAAEAGLLQELRRELDRVALADPATRAEALVRCAQAQRPRLVQLEAAEEALRKQLCSGPVGWGERREWHLGDKDQRGYSPLEIAQVMRASAFYDPVLAPGQRRLLSEIALELLNAVDNPTKATAPQPYVYFAPEPARVLFPENLPGPLAAKISVYQTKKSLLKKELYDAVYAQDRPGFGLGANPLKALAAKQGAAFAELDALAEEIRQGLATQVPDPPAAPPLSPELMERVTALHLRLIGLRRETSTQLDLALGQASGVPMQIAYRFDPGALEFVVQPGRDGRRGDRERTQQQVEAVRATVDLIAAHFGEAMAALTNERDELERAIATALATDRPGAAAAALDRALHFASVRETAERYREYRQAVFEPGLSPEQRRLLFRGALVELGLALPRGDRQPIRRGTSW